MANIRRVFLVVAISAFCGILFFMSYSNESFALSKSPGIRRNYYQNASVIDTPGCKIPFWEPFDHTVVKFFKKTSDPYNCSGKPSFIDVLPNATLQINVGILEEHYQVSLNKVTCSYQSIERNPGSAEDPTDNKFVYGSSKTLLFGVVYEYDFMLVNCFKSNNTKILTEFVSLIPNKSCLHEKLNVQLNSSISEPLNIIFLGIDSISKINFIRHLTKTRKYLSSALDAIELHGYTKVGDNTFPNLTPLLTGHFVEYYWNETVRYSYFFDELDFLWKEYAKKGYVTQLAEDAPVIATYNYLKPGFRSPPTDYYYRPMALAMEASDMKKRSKSHCFGSKMEMEILFDYFKKFTKAISPSNLYFAFTFVARLTHDVLNNAGYADGPSLKVLQYLKTSGALNNSVLFFFSDHGIRFDEIRKTYIGKFEERMPMAFLVFPPWFYKKYPEIYKNLKINEKRLTTPFDIHTTFQHLLHLNSNFMANATNSDYGLSLFEEVPTSRTCEDAGILPHWCTCHTHSPVEKDSKNVINSAHALVDTVNEWLLAKPECLNLTLNKILDARVGTPNDKVLSFDHHVNDVINRHPVFGKMTSAPLDYLLTVDVTPGGAILEGTVRYTKETESYLVLDDISRVNRYGNQSNCIDDSHLRKYCYCRNFHPS